MRLLVLAGTVLSSCLIACGSSEPVDEGYDVPPLTGDKYSLRYGPLAVGPGQEGTKCIWLRLSNTTEIKVHQLHNVLSSNSHHLIVYRDDMNTTEQLTPVDCQPFTGALNTSGSVAPIMITQKADDQLDLPTGVAYTLKPNQMIKLEMHYLNATEAMNEATADVSFYAADPGAIEHEANILFIGSPDIEIAPGEQFTLRQFWTSPSYLDLSASKIFAITGHTHKLGTSVTVSVAPDREGPMTSVYAPVPFEWSEPVTKNHRPGFAVPAGGGFEFECKYTNTTSAQIGFGESANDEMCFFWAYYYPSQGSRVCVHTERVGGVNGLDVCCPGDPSLCSLIEDMF